MSKLDQTVDLTRRWWFSLKPIKQNNDLPAKGTVAGALVVLERLKANYVLDINAHLARQGQAQISGAGKAGTRKILARFGETRTFLSEGGRTNRGLLGDIKRLLQELTSAQLESLPISERNQILTAVQEYLMDRVREYFNRERVKFLYDPTTSAWDGVHSILEAAREVGKEGPIAQYLVGAKLALRFPELDIRNDNSSTQDVVSGSPGDFVINDTAFHVTIAPNTGHLEKCRINIQDGYHVYLLVPDRVLPANRLLAESFLPRQITTQSIESFVAQNIEELSSFSKIGLVSGFRRLLETYNARVDKVENDKSMLVDIPRNLLNI